ncbi:MAG: hypothetical protein ACR2PT_00740 [Endozoicomonas sp.]
MREMDREDFEVARKLLTENSCRIGKNIPGFIKTLESNDWVEQISQTKQYSSYQLTPGTPSACK